MNRRTNRVLRAIDLHVFFMGLCVVPIASCAFRSPWSELVGAAACTVCLAMRSWDWISFRRLTRAHIFINAAVNESIILVLVALFAGVKVIVKACIAP